MLTVVLSCLSCPAVCMSVCNVGVLWPNGWTDQNETCLEVGLGPGHIVLDGDPAPPPKGHSPKFWNSGQTAGWIKMPLGTDVGLSPGDIVLDGDPASPPLKGA